MVVVHYLPVFPRVWSNQGVFIFIVTSATQIIRTFRAVRAPVTAAGDTSLNLQHEITEKTLVRI
jgi:hypothetical protein